jgi:hypothetical protein
MLKEDWIDDMVKYSFRESAGHKIDFNEDGKEDVLDSYDSENGKPVACKESEVGTSKVSKVPCKEQHVGWLEKMKVLEAQYESSLATSTIGYDRHHGGTDGDSSTGKGESFVSGI